MSEKQHVRRRTLVVLLAIASLTACGRHEPVVFTAMGCGPYNASDETALNYYIQLEANPPQSDFIVHLGDIAGHRPEGFGDEYFARMAVLLGSHHRVPTFIVPGDNEWNDQDDPDKAWQDWSRHLLHFDKRFDFDAKVHRQPQRSENFMFVLKGVLFIGINKVGGRVHDEAEWRRRLADDAQWVAGHLDARKKQVRAAVIFAQADPGGFEDLFLNPFAAAAARFAKPILYIHADGHHWFVRAGDWQPNIVHVQVDRLNSQFPPIRVSVTTNPVRTFEFDRRLPLAYEQTQP